MFDNFDLILKLYQTPGIILGLALHEFAHALVADRLGDPTPRSQGRITLSPLRHLDPFGLLFIYIFGFGWAKPVEVNRKYFQNPRRDDILVSAAGPFTNLLIAVVSAALLKAILLGNFMDGDYENILKIVMGMLVWSMIINISLFIFNLLPAPPLDGFHVLANLLPHRFNRQVAFLYRYGFAIIFILLFFGGSFISIPVRYVFAGICYVMGIPNGILS